MQHGPTNENRESTPSAAVAIPMMKPGRLAWRPRALMISHLAAAVLLVTWLVQPMRGCWDAADLQVFRWLNNSLAVGYWWQLIWAVANWRGFDLVAGSCIVMLLAYSIKTSPQRSLLAGWISVALLALAALAVKVVVEGLVVRGGLMYHRASPTVALNGSFLMSELVPWIKAKERSPWSFPSDHGAVLLAVMFYLWYGGRRTIAVAGTLLAVVFSLPRLVSGGHWMTDIVVGSSAMALLTTAWVMATPLHDFIVYRACRIGKRLLPTSRPDAVDDRQRDEFRRAA